MNIPGTPASHRVDMDGNMRQNESLITQFVGPENIFEKRSVVFQFENVVITPDQLFTSLEGVEYGKVLSSDNHVSQMVDSIVVGDDSIPPLDHFSVHFFCGSKGSEGRAVFALEFRPRVLVSEMGVTDQPCVRHRLQFRGISSPRLPLLNLLQA